MAIGAPRLRLVEEEEGGCCGGYVEIGAGQRFWL